MAGAPAAEKPAKGRLADNIVHFARALRKAGVPVGTSQVRDAVRAAAVAAALTLVAEAIGRTSTGGGPDLSQGLT